MTVRGGAIVRQARRRARLTQRELAARVGTTQSALARLERGDAEPSFRRVLELVRASGFELRMQVREPSVVDAVEQPPPDLASLAPLVRRGVRAVVSGRVAARLRGCPVAATVPCVVPDVSRSNLQALSLALDDMGARLRTPDGTGSLPFDRSATGLGDRPAWRLATAQGDVDIVFAPAGTGGFGDLATDASPVPTAAGALLVASVDDVTRQLEAEGDDADAVAALRATT